MIRTKLRTICKAMPPGLADLMTPVSIYLKIRDRYPNSILLESSDYHGNRNSMTHICFGELSTFRLEGGVVRISYHNGATEEYQPQPPGKKGCLSDLLKEYMDSFNLSPGCQGKAGSANGLFGYTSYDAVRYFDTIRFGKKPSSDTKIPDMHYALYRFTISINHFSNQMWLLENIPGDENPRMDEVSPVLSLKAGASFRFNTGNSETSNISDGEYMEMVRRGREYCHLGDVFQVVLSRQFRQEFTGDEFNVYRALRSINPSPYLFYFDYGGFRLFGSSPEAQLVIENNLAHIHPIAGTFKRSGNDEQDRQIAIDLTNDQKENSEHVMLVDLARNDLSRNSDQVKVRTFREIQYYSHVIHLVSEVTGELRPGTNPVQVFSDSFPAGTLSGAPKFRAMEIIDDLENRNRGYYGGALGYFGFNGDLHHAIMIRSFLSKGNTLYYQAGAGIVAGSVEENELMEVNNKLGALKKAIETGSEM